MTFTYRYRFSIVLCVLLVFAAGCGKGPKTYRVEGTVTFQGSPLAGASVTFIPTDEARTGSGARTDAEGKFRLMSSFGGMGAEPGMYAVTITKKAAVPTGRKVWETDPWGERIQVDEVTAVETLPGDYTSFRTTPYKEITVEAKSLNTINFDLQ